MMVTLSYSLWYLGLNVLVSLSTGSYAPLFPLLAIELISALIALAVMAAKGAVSELRFNPIYSVLSGIFLACGNYMFFTTINSNGIPFAGSFAAAEIVVFSLLLWASTRTRKSVGFYVIGSALVAAGLIVESFRLSGSSVMLNAPLVEYGVALAVLYGIGTFFYYISLERTKRQMATMFAVQLSEAAFFAVLLAAYSASITLPHFSAYYVIVVFAVAMALFLSFFGETAMVNMLIPFGKGAVSTGYTLSDLQLIPVLMYSLAINPTYWASYTPGIALIVIGSVFLQRG